MEQLSTPAGQAPRFPTFADSTYAKLPYFALQMFARDDDDDDLPDSTNVDIGSLSDDVAQLKGLIRTLMGDNRIVRKEAGKRRTALRAAENQIKELSKSHETAIETVKGEAKTELQKTIDRLGGEHKTALAAVTGERDTAVTEREALKGEKETLNRSNGQLRSKFREQFVDQRVRNDLEKRGAHNVDDAMKLLDVSKIEFDEEKLGVKDEAALKAHIDTFSTERPYLFGTPRPGSRGTTPGRGTTGTTTGGTPTGKTDFSDTSRSADDITRSILTELNIV